MPPLPISEFEHRLDDQLNLLRTIVEMESPTTDKRALDVLGRYLADRMARSGFEVRRYAQKQAGDHWLGEWGTGSGGILLLVHMDTVHPLGSLDHMPCVEQDGKLFGPGVLDMKGGGAMALIAFEALRQNGMAPSRRVSLLCTSDEETGSHTSRGLLEDLARRHDVVFCLEPALPDGSLKTWRKGVGIFRVQAIGRAAHAGGDPENGINAILEIAHQIQQLQELERPEVGTTLNMGKIAGGIRSNVVPTYCRLLVDLRVKTSQEQTRLDRALNELSPVLEGAQINVEGEWNRPPMPCTPTISQAFDQAKSIAMQLGIQLSQGGTGGASDANFLAPLGIPLLDGLGPVGGGAHSEREFLLIGELPRRTALLAALISEWPLGS